MKFFIILFTFLSPGVLQVQGEKKVETMEQCVEEAYKINSDGSVPFNAACIPAMKDKMI
jgi:hypothetical protein